MSTSPKDCCLSTPGPFSMILPPGVTTYTAQIDDSDIYCLGNPLNYHNLPPRSRVEVEPKHGYPIPTMIQPSGLSQLIH